VIAKRLLLCAGILLLALSLYAQDDEAPPQHRPQPDRGPSVVQYLFGYGFVIQILAIVVWARRGGDRFWIWIIIIGGVIGAIAYFLIDGMPDFRALARTFKGPARRRQIRILRALVLDNPSAGNYEQLGELLIQERKWAEARDAFDKAIASRTDLLDPFYWRGVAAFELGDDAAAIADLQRVVASDPKYDYSRAMCLLARALARAGRTEEAGTTFDRLTGMTSAAESMSWAAEFYAGQGRNAEALGIVENILARKPTMPAYQKRRDRLWLWKASRLRRKLRKLAGPARTATA